MHTLNANYTNLNTNRINQMQKMQLKYPMVMVRGERTFLSLANVPYIHNVDEKHRDNLESWS